MRTFGRLPAAGFALAVAAVAFATPAGAASTASAVSTTPATGRITAVVSFRGTAPVRAPGLRVVAAFPHVGAELVRATPSALAALRGEPRVVGVSPDTAVHVAGATWKRDDSNDSGVFAADAIGGRAGRPGEGYGVNVALIDTGLTDTPALNRASGRVTDGVDTSPLLAGKPALTSGRFTDGYGHGTFLGSIIAGDQVAGTGHRALGIAPAARIVVVKVSDDNGRTSLATVLAGMDWVAAHAQAIQVATVALAQDRPTAPAYGADPLTAAVEHLRSVGITVVAAAGNTPGQVGDPGMDPQALTAGASDANGQVASFSGSGNVDGVAKPDVVAPGLHIYGEMPWSTRISAGHGKARQANGLFLGSGTSEATAVTAGIAAIVASDNPGATPAQIKAALRESAQRVRDPAAGQGLVTIPHKLRINPDGTNRRGVDLTGESALNAQQWLANAWLGGSWLDWLTHSWSGPAWDSHTWSSHTWSSNSWSTSSWSGNNWSTSSWSGNNWSSHTWSTSTWSSHTWSEADWGDES